MTSGGDFQKAIDLINNAEHILITTHIKPDGDACGCVAAMADVLTGLGKEVKLIFLSPPPQWYEFLFAGKVPVLGQHVSLQQLQQGQFAQPDLIMIIDTNCRSQLPEFDQYLKQTDKPVLVIDHHNTSDALGAVEIIDPTAAATSLLVCDLLRRAHWPITETIAHALFVALATDTGWFQFSNTDSRSFRCCADLIDAGANPTQLHHDLYQSFSPQRFNLMAAMLSTLELHFDGRFATQYIRQSDFEQTGAAYSDTENLIDECRRISTVEAAALFVELKDGKIKCSLRSTGAIDVCEIAQKFGGGGHTTAAGVHLDGPLEKARNQIYDEIEKHLR